jgi:hypothetical protein
MPSFNINDVVRIKATPAQTGVICRNETYMPPLGLQNTPAICIRWNAGPLKSDGDMQHCIGQNEIDTLELNT